MSFTGRTAVVTGGSRGIGRAICLELARRGANVVFSYAGNTAAAEATRKELEALGVQTRAVQGSVADPAAVKTLIDTAVKELGSLDILVNNAGITRDNLAMMLKEEDFDAVIETNLKGAFLTMKAAARPMMKARYGRIVNLSSVVALRGNPGQINYCASKAGLIGMTKSLAKELGGRGVTVNAVAPGYIATDMTAALPDAAREAMLSAIPAGRPGAPEDVAAAVAFSPSLKAAVENDYVQYIGQSATDNGITVHLEYLMADQGGLMLFLSVSGPEEATFFMPRATFTTPDGERLEGCSVLMDSVAPGELSNAITVAFNGEEESQLPESLRLTCEVQAHIPDVTDAGEWTADAVVTFDLPLDQRFRGQGRTVEVNRWLELDGNNIRIVDLELYPTHARLNLEQDPDNAEELQSLDFYLEDKKGNRYEKGSASGLTAMGDSYLFESPYFSDPDSLTLHITKAEWLEKSQKFITVSLKTGEALEPMPGGMEISAIRLDDTTAQVAFLAPMPPASSETNLNFYQLGTGFYRTPDGTVKNTGGHSTYASDILWRNTPYETPIPEGYFVEEYTIEHCYWDVISMELFASRRTTFEVPVVLTLQ